MEKDILKILLGNKKEVPKDKNSSKKISDFFNDLDKLDKERLKSKKYKCEIAELITK